MTHTFRSAVIAGAALAWAACTGGLEPVNVLPDGGTSTDPNPTGSARQIFDRDVLPALTAKCGACHAGDPLVAPTKFMGAIGNSADDYDSVIADESLHGGFDPTLAALITHRHSGLGIEFSPDEESKVAAWINKEREERGDPGPGSGGGGLAEFSGCMSLADWEATLANRIGLITTPAGTCQSCHGYGAAGVYLSSSSAKTFEMNRHQLFLSHLVKVQSGEIIANRDKLASKASDPGHPPYLIAPDDEKLARLAEFVSLTNERVAQNVDNCTAIGFPATP